jgi:putative ABC transport system permease protein
MLSDWLFRLRKLVRRRSVESEFNDEVEFHLAQETEKLILSGLSREEAQRRARLAFGFPELVKDDCRQARGTRWIEDLGYDIAYGLRLLRMNPSFTLVAVFSLALGIGANTAIFQLLDTVRLRDLPVASPQELYSIKIGDGPFGNFFARFSDLSFAQWEEIGRRQQAFSTNAVWSPRGFNLAEGGETRPAQGLLVSGSFFETLGVQALRGRVIERQDDVTGGCGSAPAVLSYSFWQREFGGDPKAIGGQLRIDGHTFPIAGVTGPQFFGVEVGRTFDIALPLCTEAALASSDSLLAGGRHNYWLSSIGRLREGWTLERANAHLRTISAELFAATLPPDMDAADSAQRYKSHWLQAVSVAKGVSWLRVEYEKPLWLLLGSAALVLLIACGNLANLLLARASIRGQEITVRLALGASKGRLVRQLLTESLLLSVAGAVLGLLLAGVLSRMLVSFLVTADNPVALNTTLDWRILMFSSTVALVACALFGLAPALRSASNATPSSVRSVTGSRDRALLRRGLAIVQVALCIVLVAGAMLFGRSAHKLLTADLGFQPSRVMVTSLDTRRLGYSKERQKVVFQELLERVRSTAGVEGAAQSNIIPSSGWVSNSRLVLDGKENLRTRISLVSAGYFATMATPMLAGRDFNSNDTEHAEAVAIVNEEFARQYLAGANPVGHLITKSNYANKVCRIVGLVRNTKYVALREDFQPIVFFPTSQTTFTTNYARYVVRSALPPLEATAAIRGAIASVSPAIDVEFLPLDVQIQQSVIRERLLAAVGGGFGILAGLLAAGGLYGLLSYSVQTRRSEIGIRMALGADRSSVVGLVVREAGMLLVAGVVAGLVITLAAGTAAKSLLYGLEPNDPLTLTGTVLMLLVIGVIAALVPARRAATIDPLRTLRQE